MPAVPPAPDLAPLALGQDVFDDPTVSPLPSGRSLRSGR